MDLNVILQIPVPVPQRPMTLHVPIHPGLPLASAAANPIAEGMRADEASQAETDV